MSNETDLDWLARNVHEWSDGDGITLLGRGCSFFDTGVGRSVHVYAVDGSDYTTIKEKDWLARRAELQNKPSWNDAPEWAVYMAQSPNGHWEFFAVKPRAEGWWRHPIGERSSANNASIRGAILGDWRDTLEKRPEQTIADICRGVTDENRHEEIFEPFIRIEDNQEQDMKQDNGWFERGELPPVGAECEFCGGTGDADDPWHPDLMDGDRVTVIAHFECGIFTLAAFTFKSRNPNIATVLVEQANYGCFRPIRTERDVLIEILKKTDDTDDRIADAILAAGFKRGAA